MGRIECSYIMPHPPIIVPEIGRGEEKGASETIRAMQRAADEIARLRPDTIIITTPHGPVFRDYIYISTSGSLSGNFSMFRAPGVSFEFENNMELTQLIIEKAAAMGIPCGGLEKAVAKRLGVSQGLDHGALVPLYFIVEKYRGFKLVHIATSFLPVTDLYRFGMAIEQAVEKTDESVVFIASGDLSHRLEEDGPYGFSKKGVQFDKLLIESVRAGDVERILEFDEGFCEEAAECGRRSFIIMFGAYEGFEIETEVYSHEGPFGVGYAIARINRGKPSGSSVIESFHEKRKKRLSDIREQEDPYVKLARASLEHYVRHGKILPVPDNLPREMLENRAGVFVSIKKYGMLRGCIGTTEPTKDNIAQEIIHNAISSGTRDPRFDPVEEWELGDLVYSVDVLSEPEPIKSIDELDVVRYGVIVKKGWRTGLLLPNLEGVDTPEKQVSIALQKAGIRADEDFEMLRFEVVRHT